MAAFTAATRNVQIDWLTGVATPPAVATRYVTTFNGDPQAGGTENIATISGSANRVSITPSMNGASSGSAANNAELIITASAVGGATVNFVAVMSAVTGGVVMGSGAVSPRVVGVGDGLKFLVGGLTLSIG